VHTQKVSYSPTKFNTNVSNKFGWIYRVTKYLKLPMD